MRTLLTATTIVFALTSAGQAGLVWESTFDTDADGVVQTRADNTDDNAGIIGSNSGGTQEINTEDVGGTLSNKAGRPTSDNGGPASLNTTTSFSALYTFTWSFPNDPLNTGIGFQAVAHSTTSPHNSRQNMGARIIRQVTAGGDNLVNLGGAWGSEGFIGYTNSFAGNVNLGPNLDGRPLQLAYGFDDATQELGVALYDGITGALLTEAPAQDIATFNNAGGNAASILLEKDNLNLTHVGWSDGNNGGGFTETIWNVDSLRFYDDANGAFGDVVPEPATLALLGIGGVMLLARRRHG